MSEKKLLIIGIDGGTWEVLDRAVEQGHMPFLASLLSEGQRAVLFSTVPAVTPAAWGAFQTGRSPEELGVYGFERWDRRSGESHLVDSTSLPATIWEIASQSGLRVGTINVPMTFPPYEINGFMVSGIMTPKMESDWTYPRHLKQELLKAVPHYRVLDRAELKTVSARQDLEAFLNYMCALPAMRADAAKHLIHGHAPDLLMVHFHASDFVQHAAWRFLDPVHPLYDAEKERRILRSFYGKLDACMKRVVTAFEEKTGGPFPLIVMSDHGFGTHSQDFHLGNWLVQEGYCLDKWASARHRLLRDVVRLVRRLDVLGWRRKVVPSGMRERVGHVGFPRWQDRVLWKRSLAVSMGFGPEGFIFLNARTEQDRRKVAELKEELLSLAEPGTGQRPVKSIHETDLDPENAAQCFFPDLIVEPNPGWSIKGAFMPDRNVFEQVAFESEPHVGIHAPEGIFLGVNCSGQYDSALQIGEMFRVVLDELGIKAEQEDVRPRDYRWGKQNELLVRERLADLGYM